MMYYTLEEALERGVCDIATFRLGLRPLLTENVVMRMVLNRFDRVVEQNAPRPKTPSEELWDGGS